MTVYAENPKDSYKKLLKPINEVNMFVEHKFHK